LLGAGFDARGRRIPEIGARRASVCALPAHRGVGSRIDAPREVGARSCRCAHRGPFCGGVPAGPRARRVLERPWRRLRLDPGAGRRGPRRGSLRSLLRHRHLRRLRGEPLLRRFERVRAGPGVLELPGRVRRRRGVSGSLHRAVLRRLAVRRQPGGVPRPELPDRVRLHLRRDGRAPEPSVAGVGVRVVPGPARVHGRGALRDVGRLPGLRPVPPLVLHAGLSRELRGPPRRRGRTLRAARQRRQRELLRRAATGRTGAAWAACSGPR
jgi:hypothetical protein